MSWEHAEAVIDQDKQHEAWTAVAANTLALTGSVFSGYAALTKLGAKLGLGGSESAGAAMLGGLLLAAGNGVLGIQAVFAYRRAKANGDNEAAKLYRDGALVFVASAVIGGYAAVVGATALLGPFGIALALMAIGVALLWAGANAERTPTELWLTRCYFGKGGEHHEVWTDRQQTRELTALNALVANCRAEMDFNDDDWGLKEFFTGYDTIRFKLSFGHFYEGHGAYRWKLQIQNADGRWLTPTQEHEEGAGPTPQMSAITPDEQARQREAARHPIIKSYDDSKYLTGHVMHVEGSFEVDTSRCQNARIVATYWPEKADRHGEVTMRLAKED